jgi:integrase
VLETLKDLRARTIHRSGACGAEAAELVFTSPAGRPIYSDKLAKRFKGILRQAGLPAIRLYDLRHTAATLALSAGVPPKVVAEQLGHASAAFTLDVYSHLLPHMQDQAAMKVEQVLLGRTVLQRSDRIRSKKAHSKAGSKKAPAAVNVAPGSNRRSFRA